MERKSYSERLVSGLVRLPLKGGKTLKCPHSTLALAFRSVGNRGKGIKANFLSGLIYGLKNTVNEVLPDGVLVFGGVYRGTTS